MPGVEVRFVEAGQADGETDGTRLFAALSAALTDVPHDRVAGAILMTDGRVHDVPTEAAALGFAAPVHGLITGQRNERDRRVVLVTAPRFGIVGQAQTITFRVEDQGAPPGAGAGDGAARRRDHREPQRARRRQREHQHTDSACRTEHRGDRGVGARRRAHRRQQSRGRVHRRRARQAAGPAGFRRAACRRADVAQSSQVGRQRRPRALHHPAPAGEAGRNPDQRVVPDRVPDPRAVPTEDQRVPAHHLRPLRAPGGAADHLLRQHRALCAPGRRGAGGGGARLCEPDQHLAHATRGRSCRPSRAVA